MIDALEGREVVALPVAFMQADMATGTHPL
jgi:hypothetical protein